MGNSIFSDMRRTGMSVKYPQTSHSSISRICRRAGLRHAIELERYTLVVETAS